METGTPQEKKLSIAGDDLFVRTGGCGPNLVLLHHDIGNTGWGALHQELAKHFTVVAPELPGYGRSARPDWARHPRDLAAAASLAMDELKIAETDVVGLGFGGWVALELATFNQARMRRLTVAAPMGVKPSEGDIFDQFLVGHEDYVKLGFHDPEKYAALFGQQATIEQLVEWDFAREMTTRIAWKPYMFNHALPHLLKSVTIPTLIAWGADDKIVPPKCGPQLQQLLKNAMCQIIENCGHWVDLEQPQILARHIVTRAMEK